MFIAHLLKRNARIEEDLVDQLFNSTEKRLARVLCSWRTSEKRGRPEPVVAKINQETIAEMIGATRSRVSYFMNKFRKLGFIEYNGHLAVHSSLLSVVLAEQPRNVRESRSGSRAGLISNKALPLCAGPEPHNCIEAIYGLRTS